MDVLVAGGTGFIGSNLCEELLDRGHRVTALSRTSDDSAVPDGVDLAVGDVTAFDSIAEIVADHDAVVNLVSLSPLYQSPRGTNHDEVHRGGTENLVRAAETGDADRFLQISGLGADTDGPTAYIRAKGRAEEIVRASSLDWTIVRPAVVFGEGAEFIPFTKSVTTPYITALPGGGKTPFQPIWIGDFAPMLAAAVEEERHVGETYEIGGSEVETLADVTRLVYAAAGRPVTILPVPLVVAKIGFTITGPLPLIPFGPDQARSLELDHTVSKNDIDAFGWEADELLTLESYLERTS